MTATLPPHDADAELSLLGALLLDQAMIAEVADLVVTDDFYAQTHRALWAAILTLEQGGKPVDVISIADQMKRDGTFDRSGGVELLARAMESVPSAVSARYHAQIVRKKSQLRRTITACQETIQAAMAANGDEDEIIDQGEARVLAARSGAFSVSIIEQDHLAQVLEDVCARKDQPDAGGLRTGFSDLDELLGGLRGGSYTVVGARPSMGKSSLGNNIAVNVAIGGTGALIFTLEVQAREVIENHIIARSGIDSLRFRSGRISEAEIRIAMEGSNELAHAAPIVIVDKRGLTTQEMRAIAQREKARRGIGLIVIDYMQLLKGPRAENKQQEVTAISSGIHAMAGDLDLPVIALSQLGRAVEQREDRRPRMSDLRESGSIEQDATAVLLLYREDYYAEKENRDIDPAKRGVCEIIIAKNRNGPTGSARLMFQKESLRFRDLAWKQVASPYGV